MHRIITHSLFTIFFRFITFFVTKQIETVVNVVKKEKKEKRKDVWKYKSEPIPTEYYNGRRDLRMQYLGEFFICMGSYKLSEIYRTSGNEVPLFC
jgi:hypothetical protein